MLSEDLYLPRLQFVFVKMLFFKIVPAFEIVSIWTYAVRPTPAATVPSKSTRHRSHALKPTVTFPAIETGFNFFGLVNSGTSVAASASNALSWIRSVLFTTSAPPGYCAVSNVGVGL